MSELISGEDLIRSAEPGAMVYSRLQTAEGGHWETGLLVREEPKYVKAFGRNPIIELRGGLMHEGRVALIATLVRVGAGKDAQLYECWWNFHGEENREAFYDLASQERLGIFFFTPERAKAVGVRNGYRDLFTRAVTALAAMPAWGMREFDAARSEIYRRYPTMQDLWSQLN